MKEIRLGLDLSKKYVIACSFGPDSMALLHAALKEKYSIVVAHVNYRKRDDAIIEQQDLTKYCEQRKIKLYVLDLLGQEVHGNFQEWARKKRYKFFKEVALKEGADSVLVAHNEDDVIETYLMQKKRGNFVKNYGISAKNGVFGVEIERPLLGYSKAYLQAYDEENGVPYSIDESNLTDHYTRNKIRHSIVQKMNVKEREDVLAEIKNSKSVEVEFKTHFDKTTFINFSYEQIVVLLDHYMEMVLEHRNLSEKFVGQIKAGFKTKVNQRIEITKSLWLELDYEDVFLVNGSKIKPYQYKFKTTISNEWIDIDFSKGADDRGIKELSSEITLKNCDKNDKIIIKDYLSQIRRQFIDWKMPLFLREIWPGIYDEKGQLIYVPRYRKNFLDQHKSKFKIRTDYFTEF